MAKAIFNVFFKIIKKIVEIFLTPINLLVVNLFPNLSNIITTFNNAVSTLIGGTIGYFSSILPPITRTIILLWFSILISYYGVLFPIHVVMKVIEIIKKIKVW